MKVENYICDFCGRTYNKHGLCPTIFLDLYGQDDDKDISLESKCIEYSRVYLANFGDACNICVDKYAKELYDKFKKYAEAKK